MRLILLSIFSFFLISVLTAQQNVNDPQKTATKSSSDEWTFEADAFYYITPNEKNTTTFIGYADHDALHLEARYNYEDQNTASFFGGYSFETGKKIVFDATPMLGFAVGNIKGMIPALELNLTWRKLDYYSESEYVFDFEDKENNYFYIWAEFGITPFDNFRTGITITRTILFQSDYDFQRGLLAQYSFWKLKTIVYYFNPFDKGESYLITTLGFEF